MIRGVNRRVIEVRRPNSDYFDRAFLVVKDEKISADDSALKASAELYLSSLSKGKKKKGQLFIKALSYFATLVLGFVLATMLT